MTLPRVTWRRVLPATHERRAFSVLTTSSLTRPNPQPGPGQGPPWTVTSLARPGTPADSPLCGEGRNAGFGVQMWLCSAYEG